MSAPQTNIEKQEKRHAGPLIGITAGIVLAVVLLLAFIFFNTGPVDEGNADAVESTVVPEGSTVAEPAADGSAPAGGMTGINTDQ